MCADPSTVNLVRDQLVLSNFDQTRDIAQSFRVHISTGQAIATTSARNGYPIMTTALGFNGYTAFQGPPYSQPSFLNSGAASSPTATAQSGYSSEVVSGEEREEADFVFDGEYSHPGPPLWP